MDKEQTTGPRPGCLCWWWNPYVGKCHRSHTTSVHSHMPSAMGSARSNMSGWAFLPQRRQHWLGNRGKRLTGTESLANLEARCCCRSLANMLAGPRVSISKSPSPAVPPEAMGNGTCLHRLVQSCPSGGPTRLRVPPAKRFRLSLSSVCRPTHHAPVAEALPTMWLAFAGGFS